MHLSHLNNAISNSVLMSLRDCVVVLWNSTAAVKITEQNAETALIKSLSAQRSVCSSDAEPDQEHEHQHCHLLAEALSSQLLLYSSMSVLIAEMETC